MLCVQKQIQGITPSMTEKNRIIYNAQEARTANIRFGNMAGQRIYSQLFVRYSASVPADE